MNALKANRVPISAGGGGWSPETIDPRNANRPSRRGARKDLRS